eukprot:3762417-Rhodomonas_salina.1
MDHNSAILMLVRGGSFDRAQVTKGKTLVWPAVNHCTGMSTVMTNSLIATLETCTAKSYWQAKGLWGGLNADTQDGRLSKVESQFGMLWRDNWYPDKLTKLVTRVHDSRSENLGFVLEAALDKAESALDKAEFALDKAMIAALLSGSPLPSSSMKNLNSSLNVGAVLEWLIQIKQGRGRFL